MPFVAGGGGIDALPLAAPSVAPVPGGAGAPTSIRLPGRYDDVNGNLRANVADVVRLFNHL